MVIRYGEFVPRDLSNYPIYPRNSIYPRAWPADGNGQFAVTTPPTEEPITVDEVKLFGRIDGDYEDALILGLIKTARENAEPYLGRAIVTQTITYAMDYWPSYVIELPRAGGLIAITKVVTLDEDDTETVYSSDNYYSDTLSEPGKLIIRQTATLPYNSDRSHGGYQIVYTAGYGSASDVPEGLKTGLKLWVMHGYENRTLSKDPPPEARGYINNYKISKGLR